MARLEILKPFIRSWEGGFANVPGDKGGATKWGVTIGTFQSIYGKNKTVQDLKNMTEEQWDYIFRKYFWDKWKADQIESQAIANLVVDWLWASGAKYGIKLPQKVLRYTLGQTDIVIDGLVGPKTLAAINSYPNQEELFNKLHKEREDFFKRIGVGTQKKFLKGWLNRNNGIKINCLVCNTAGNSIIYF